MTLEIRHTKYVLEWETHS